MLPAAPGPRRDAALLDAHDVGDDVVEVGPGRRGRAAWRRRRSRPGSRWSGRRARRPASMRPDAAAVLAVVEVAGLVQLGRRPPARRRRRPSPRRRRRRAARLAAAGGRAAPGRGRRHESCPPSRSARRCWPPSGPSPASGRPPRCSRRSPRRGRARRRAPPAREPPTACARSTPPVDGRNPARAYGAGPEKQRDEEPAVHRAEPPLRGPGAGGLALPWCGRGHWAEVSWRAGPRRVRWARSTPRAG